MHFIFKWKPTAPFLRTLVLTGLKLFLNSDDFVKIKIFIKVFSIFKISIFMKSGASTMNETPAGLVMNKWWVFFANLIYNCWWQTAWSIIIQRARILPYQNDITTFVSYGQWWTISPGFVRWWGGGWSAVSRKIIQCILYSNGSLLHRFSEH